MAELVVAFDAVGTLFDLGKLREEMPRVLHHATALTLAGEWAPLDEIARAVDDELAEKLAGLDPYPEALEALGHVRAAGAETWILTNGTRENTERLVEEGGLSGLVGEIHTVEEVRRYKPDPAVYGLLPAGSVLVAAHGWDVEGARRAGYEATWIDREEEEWLLPTPPPDLRAADLIEAARLATQL